MGFVPPRLGRQRDSQPNEHVHSKSDDLTMASASMNIKKKSQDFDESTVSEGRSNLEKRHEPNSKENADSHAAAQAGNQPVTTTPIKASSHLPLKAKQTFQPPKKPVVEIPSIPSETEDKRSGRGTGFLARLRASTPGLLKSIVAADERNEDPAHSIATVQRDERRQNGTWTSFRGSDTLRRREELAHDDRDDDGSRQPDHALKRQHQDTIRSSRIENNPNQAEIENQRDTINQLKDRLTQVRAKLEERERAFEKHNVRMRQVLESRNEQIEKLEGEKAELRENLEDCKDRIFNMQPVQGMADTQLRDKYTHLCSSVEYWVENCFGGVENLIGRLYGVEASENSSRQANVVRLYLEPQDFEALQDNPDIEMALLQAMISRHLYWYLLNSERIFPGLDYSTESWLSQILDGLDRLKPAKDREAIQMWRVDLHRTLEILEPAAKASEEFLRHVEASIMKCLIDLRSMDCQDGADQVQCRQLVRETADLAKNIRQSMADYDFEFHFDRFFDGEKKVFRLEDLKKCTVIDSRTGSLLRSTAAPIVGEGGRVGEALFVVHPAFVRSSAESCQKIVLVKSTIVVKFDHAIPRGGKAKFKP